MASQVVSWHVLHPSSWAVPRLQSCVWVCGRDGDLGSAGPCSLQGCTLGLGFLSILEDNTKVHGSVQLAWTVQILCCDLYQRKGGGHCKQIMSKSIPKAI